MGLDLIPGNQDHKYVVFHAAKCVMICRQHQNINSEVQNLVPLYNLSWVPLSKLVKANVLFVSVIIIKVKRSYKRSYVLGDCEVIHTWAIISSMGKRMAEVRSQALCLLDLWGTHGSLQTLFRKETIIRVIVLYIRSSSIYQGSQG